MASPPVCFSCGAENLWEIFYKKTNELLEVQLSNHTDIKDREVYVGIEMSVLDDLGITRICCRRMYLGDQKILLQINTLYKNIIE
jgi:DNA-directed RNA polymerase subunit N (RpoN/RPB10)